jgi:branched-chain amino acid transport system ATP-binding protein
MSALEVTALLGRNGVGKTSTIRSILGLNKATGSIKLFGKEVIGMQTHQIVRLGVGYVPEDREIFAMLSVKENLALAERGKVNYDFVYSLFPDLLTRTLQRAGTLSGGQQQMVAIGRAILNENRILLIDEPTKGLAPKLVGEVGEALTQLNETMLLVEQNIALVRRIAEHIIVMDQGRIVFQGDPANLNDVDFVQRMLGVSHAGGH